MSRIKPVSKQRAADRRREVAGYQAVSLRAQGRCEVMSDVCSGSHEVSHHRLPRSASSVRNPERHSPEVLMAACRACHEFLHSHPTLAYEKGWLIRR